MFPNLFYIKKTVAFSLCFAAVGLVNCKQTNSQLASTSRAKEISAEPTGKVFDLSRRNQIFSLEITGNLNGYLNPNAPAPRARPVGEYPLKTSLSAGNLNFNDTVNLKPFGDSSLNDCVYPKAVLKFNSIQTMAMPLLAGLTSLRFLSHCNKSTVNNGISFNTDLRVQKEYLVYRILNNVMPASLEARFVNVTYNDIQFKNISTHNGLFLEEFSDAEKRWNGKIPSNGEAATKDIDVKELARAEIFSQLIMNGDFEVAVLKNSFVVKQNSESVTHIVLFDFDHATFTQGNAVLLKAHSKDVKDDMLEGLQKIKSSRGIDTFAAAAHDLIDLRPKIIQTIQTSVIDATEKQYCIDFFTMTYDTLNIALH